jgi:putative salt-induced outer membrane protein
MKPTGRAFWRWSWSCQRWESEFFEPPREASEGGWAIRAAVLLLCAMAPARADQVILMNGDRISGAIQELQDEKLFLRSEMIGQVTLPWKNVRSIVSTQPLYIVLKNGDVFTGSLLQSDRGFILQNSERTLVVPKDDVVILRSFEQQAAWQAAEERRLAPHFFDPWSGYIDLGLSLTRGNAKVATYSTSLNGVRATAHHKLTLNFTSLYARNNTTPPAAVTANLRRGNAEWDLNISPLQYGFVTTSLEYDQLQKLHLRAVGGLGYGLHVVKTRRNTFDLSIGTTANRESFTTGLRRLSSEGLLSEESTHIINHSLTLKQRFVLYPNLTDAGNYRITFDGSAVTTLLRWLSWQVSVSDRYLSNPLPGTLPNDLLLTTGFRLTLLPLSDRR